MLKHDKVYGDWRSRRRPRICSYAASACGGMVYAGYGYGGSGYGYRSYGGCGAYGYAVTSPYYGAYGYPVTTAHITGLMDMHLSAAMATAVRGCGAYGYVPVRHYGGCGTYGYAATVVITMGVTDAPCITAHITGLMDTHHSSRGIEFIDRFTLSQVTAPLSALWLRGVRGWMLDALLTRCG